MYQNLIKESYPVNFDMTKGAVWQLHEGTAIAEIDTRVKSSCPYVSAYLF